MLLTLDIGNTNIKSALFTNDQINDFKIHTSVSSVLEYIRQITFSSAAICSVNPASQKILSDELSLKKIVIFETEIHQEFNVEINYQTPSTLGMDRVCSVVGALEMATQEKIISEGQYLITIDFGTATTINVVSPQRKFIGGLIAPGIKTMLSSLNDKTAQLPLPDVQSYKGLIGNSTNSSIASGVITATIGMINETINKLKADSNKDVLVYVTGGNSQFIVTHLNLKVNFEKALVLKGLKIIYDLNN